MYLSKAQLPCNIFWVFGGGVKETCASSAEHLDRQGLDLLLQNLKEINNQKSQ